MTGNKIRDVAALLKLQPHKDYSFNCQEVEFSNSVDSDEAAHNEPPYLNLHNLPFRI